MPHTTALYYPHIDIHDGTWLKTALLYWDKVATIVPESAPSYDTEWCRDLAREGIVEAVRVGPGDEDVEAVSEQVLDLLTSPALPRALAHVVRSPEDRAALGQHVSQLNGYAHMHPDKLADQLRYYLRELGLSRDDHDRHWLRVAGPFADYYMAILASEKARRLGLALTTYDSVYDDVTRLHDAGSHVGTVPLGYRDRLDHRWDGPRRYRRPRGEDAGLLAEGVVAHVVFEALQLRPDTSLADVLAFRERHSVELARFRTAIGTFAQGFQDGLSDAALYQRAVDVYANDLRPQIHELHAKLNEGRVKAVWGAFKTTAFTSGGPVALGTALATTVLGPYALAVGAGVSAVLTAIAYRQDREQLLRQSPFSYVLAVNTALGSGFTPGQVAP